MRTAHWYTVVLVIISLIVGFLLHLDNLPENIKKIIIIGSLFGIIGACVNPVDD